MLRWILSGQAGARRRLPLAYFATRAAGQKVARMREPYYGGQSRTVNDEMPAYVLETVEK
jgi:hypothetical protein